MVGFLNEHWTIRGTSGQSYLFEAIPLGSLGERGDGVYVLAKRQSGVFSPPVYRSLYVGETGKPLRDRLAEHETSGKFDCVRLHGPATHILYLYEPSLERRLDIERDVRLSEKPPCNDEPLSGFFNDLLRLVPRGD